MEISMKMGGMFLSFKDDRTIFYSFWYPLQRQDHQSQFWLMTKCALQFRLTNQHTQKGYGFSLELIYASISAMRTSFQLSLSVVAICPKRVNSFDFGGWQMFCCIGQFLSCWFYELHLQDHQICCTKMSPLLTFCIAKGWLVCSQKRFENEYEGLATLYLVPGDDFCPYY